MKVGKINKTIIIKLDAVNEKGKESYICSSFSDEDFSFFRKKKKESKKVLERMDKEGKSTFNKKTNCLKHAKSSIDTVLERIKNNEDKEYVLNNKILLKMSIEKIKEASKKLNYNTSLFWSIIFKEDKKQIVLTSVKNLQDILKMNYFKKFIKS